MSAPATAPGEDGRTYPGAARAALGMIVISFGAMLGPLDSAVNIAFPAITNSFGLRISDIQWIVIAYVLAQSCMSILFGKVGDIWGHRRVFIYGSALAALVHAIAGFAPNYPALVALRALQGISVGIAMSCGPALATFLFPPAKKRAALSFYTMLFGIGLAIGPIIGGWLIENFGWAGVFWYRAPIALTAVLFSFVLPPDQPRRIERQPLDVAGAFWLVMTLGSFVAMLSLVRRAADMPAIPAALFIGWIASLAIFVRIEKRAADPVVHMSYYRERAFAGIQFATLAINFFNFTVFLLAPYLLAAREETSLVMVGLLMALYPAGQISAGFIASRLSKSVSSVSLVWSGFAIAAFGIIATGLTSSGFAAAWLGAALFTAGFGLGAFQVGNLDLTTSILPASARGVAGSLVNVARLLGIVIGAALITWVFDALDRSDRAAQFRATFLLMGGLQLAFAVVLPFTLLRRKG